MICWNCGDEVDEEYEVCRHKIEGHKVCDDCYEIHLEDLAIDSEPDIPDTVKERNELFGGH